MKTNKTENFNLSEKINHMRQDIYAEDVKEFISRLKEEFKKFAWTKRLRENVNYHIDKLAGDKLT